MENIDGKERSKVQIVQRPQLSSTNLILSAVVAICLLAITVSEILGYYWTVYDGEGVYISVDNRPVPSFAFGIFVGTAISLLILEIYSRREISPKQLGTLTRILALSCLWSLGFLVLVHPENAIFFGWLAFDILIFLAILFVSMPWRRVLPSSPSRIRFLGALVLAVALTSSLAVPGALSAQRSILWSFPLHCNASRCPLGLADETSPGPPSGMLVQGRLYDFYFNVVQGGIEASLVSAPGTGNATYWSAGGASSFWHWNGAGVGEFQWSPGTTGFYQMLFLNMHYPSGSIIIVRITIA